MFGSNFATYRSALSAIHVDIIKKDLLEQGDLKNFSWNIAHQYDIDSILTGQFVFSTFSAYFGNTTISSAMKNPKSIKNSFKIQIDENVFDHLNELRKKVLDMKKDDE